MAFTQRTRVAMPGISPAVLTIIVACTAIFILQNTPLGPVLLGNLALSVGSLITGRVWSLLTFGLLHANFSHLFFNMLVLYFLGPRLEGRMGTRAFIAFYALSGLIAGIVFCVWVLLAGTPQIWVLGASGSIYGVYAMWALLWPDEYLLVWGLVPIKVKWLMLILVVASVYMLWLGEGNVAHQAHLGGILGGVLWWTFTERRSRRRPPLPPRSGRRMRMRLVPKSGDNRFEEIMRDITD